jgi:hypothetical protein
MPSLLDRYTEALNSMEITMRSPGRWVTVHRNRSGVVRTHLRPGALTRLTERELSAELQQALTDAYLAYRRRCRELRREIFGADVVDDVIQDA